MDGFIRARKISPIPKDRYSPCLPYLLSSCLPKQVPALVLSSSPALCLRLRQPSSLASLALNLVTLAILFHLGKPLLRLTLAGLNGRLRLEILEDLILNLVLPLLLTLSPLAALSLLSVFLPNWNSFNCAASMKIFDATMPQCKTNWKRFSESIHYLP